MGRSLFRPRADRDLEDFAAPPLRHAASGQSFRIVRRDDGLVFESWVDEGGARAHLLELPVDWILGSGHHARTYLYRVPSGEVFQLPLAWYTDEGRWGMAPGYDRRDHDGVTRRVRRECLFCHDAYPELTATEGRRADGYGEPQRFPAELPSGIGCQRCHGPGGEHVALASDPLATRVSLRASVVNPARLAPELRDDVCNQCHLQPSVAVPGVRRVGRGDFSYRPGTPLADYLVQVDVRQAAAAGERFEVNHQAYRLQQSRCFLASAGRLGCITCHDPHRRVPTVEREAHYRAACLTCHQATDCARPRAAPGAAHALPDDVADDLADDCVGCHMPRRRPTDVVHVVVTDHLIRRPPGDAARLAAPRAESEPVVLDAWLLEPSTVGAGADLYRTLALLRSGAARGAADHLAALLAATPSVAVEPYLDLADAWLDAGRWRDAEAVLDRLAMRHPGDARVAERRAMALAGRGEVDAALALLRAAVTTDRTRPAPWFRLGSLLLARDPAAARVALASSLELRPNFPAAWLARARAARAQGDVAAARAAYERVLSLVPADAVARGELAALGDGGRSRPD
jgi:hypothetical protein